MADRLPASFVSDREINGPIDRSKTVHVFEDTANFNLYVDDTPTANEVLMFVAKKAGTINDVGAGLITDGTTTDIDFDVEINGTPILSAAINVTDSTGNGVEVPGAISGTTAAYIAGDKITATCVITTSTGALGPWVRISRFEEGD